MSRTAPPDNTVSSRRGIELDYGKCRQDILFNVSVESHRLAEWWSVVMITWATLDHQTLHTFNARPWLHLANQSRVQNAAAASVGAALTMKP